MIDVTRLDLASCPGRWVLASDHDRLVAELRAELAAKDARIADVEELSVMRLAACSTASLQNTATSRQERIARESPYWSAAYEDICRAVDREMGLRAEIARLTETVAVCEPSARNWPTLLKRAEAAEAQVRALRKTLDAFIERCAEIRLGSPNAFYAHVDRFCATLAQATPKEGGLCAQ